MRNNPRITAKERGLLKGALRRVFSRSDLRRKVLEASAIEHSDPKHPRVKKWIRCAVCKLPSPRYLAAVDHIDPVIPVDSSFEQLGLDDTANRTWCEESNLQTICFSCHDEKSRAERELRKRNKPKGTKK